MLNPRTIKEREIRLVYESTDGKPGFMAESLFRREQNIAMKIRPDCAKQSGVKVIVQSFEILEPALLIHVGGLVEVRLELKSEADLSMSVTRCVLGALTDDLAESAITGVRIWSLELGAV